MSKVPEKCTRCGAPISWEEGASVVKCEFCGYKNNLKDDFLSLFKNYLKLRDPKKIIRNPFSLILVLPVIFLFLILNSPIQKKEVTKAEYWPTNWNKLKQRKFKGKKYPLNYDKSLKDSHTIKFKSDVGEACKYRNSLIKELNNFKLNLEKSKYEFNVRVGNVYQFGIEDYISEMWNPKNINQYPGLFKSSYNPSYSKYQFDKEKTLTNFNRIYNKLQEEGKFYWDFYLDALNNWDEESKELNRIIDLHKNRIFASNIEVLRQSGEKDWKLYSRWSISGISDLYSYYYFDRYRDSDERDEISFSDWLIKKNILDKSHFDQIQGGYYLKYSPSIKPVILSNKVCGTSK